MLKTIIKKSSILKYPTSAQIAKYLNYFTDVYNALDVNSWCKVNMGAIHENHACHGGRSRGRRGKHYAGVRIGAPRA